MINEKNLELFIENAIREDIGDGDHTSLSCIPETSTGKAQLLVKQEGIIAGVEVAKQVFKKFDKNVKIETFIQDGTPIKPGDIIFKVEGNTIALLGAERLALNIMQRMSGIASITDIHKI